MIKNERQYLVTKAKRLEFENSIKELQSEKNNDLLNKVMKDALLSQIETFDREISEYEKLKFEKPAIIVSSIDRLPEVLIKARIVNGISQKELADKLGIKEQQIQRYESTNYGTANFERIISVANSMNLHFEETRATVHKIPIPVKGYDALFLKEATSKLQSNRTLFSVQ